MTYSGVAVSPATSGASVGDAAHKAVLSSPTEPSSPRRFSEQARIVAELWSNAPEFACPREFLAVLTDELDALCSTFGKPLPGDMVEALRG